MNWAQFKQRIESIKIYGEEEILNFHFSSKSGRLSVYIKKDKEETICHDLGSVWTTEEIKENLIIKANDLIINLREAVSIDIYESEAHTKLLNFIKELIK